MVDVLCTLLIDTKLFLLEGLKEVNSGLRVNISFGFHEFKEATDRIVLLDQMKPYHRVLPCIIEYVKLIGFLAGKLLIELIVLQMLKSVFLCFLSDPYFYKLFNLGG